MAGGDEYWGDIASAYESSKGAQTVQERLASQGGTPVRDRPYPPWPLWDQGEEQALLDVLHSGQWGALGGETVRRFEQQFATLQGAQHCVAVTNGTAALRIAYRALGVGLGDEVIVPPYTFIATASAALEVGAFPIFADIDPRTYLLDPAAVEAAITPRTKVIVPVHVAGCPAELEAFRALAAKHQLRLLEDAAQAHGAAWQGQPVGAVGDLGTFSFQASKNLTGGEGGALVTNDVQVAEVVWSLHNVGRIRRGAWYQHERLGGNERITAFQAALLLAQMRRLPEQMAQREASAAYLDRELARIEGIRPLWRDPRVTSHAHHLYIFSYNAGAFEGLPRDSFVAALRAEGIPCSAGYTPLHRQAAIRTTVTALAHALGRSDPLPEVSLPESERASEEGVWLPQNLLLGTQEDMQDVVAAIEKVQRATRAGARQAGTGVLRA
jgi:dTDP-4-amino-4,6-dideoxygalactose transaminase